MRKENVIARLTVGSKVIARVLEGSHFLQFWIDVSLEHVRFDGWLNP
jgi:hypothetical protein